ncbi:unnamed protein product, partial [Staurois parvus]
TGAPGAGRQAPGPQVGRGGAPDPQARGRQGIGPTRRRPARRRTPSVQRTWYTGLRRSDRSSGPQAGAGGMTAGPGGPGISIWVATGTASSGRHGDPVTRYTRGLVNWHDRGTGSGTGSLDNSGHRVNGL